MPLVLLSPSEAWSQAIHFQGMLTDSTGAPVPDGVYSVTFRLYEDSTGATQIGSEQATVTTLGGLFNAYLEGLIQPLRKSAERAGGSDPYLGLAVESDPEMSPLLRLGSAPSSLTTHTLEGAGGGSVVGHLGVRETFETPIECGNICNTCALSSCGCINIESYTHAHLYIDAGISAWPGEQQSSILFKNDCSTWGDIVVDEADPGHPLLLNSIVTNDVVLSYGGGNVGIGANLEPETKLDVVTDAQVAGRFRNDRSSLGGVGVNAATIKATNSNSSGIALYCESNTTDATIVATNTQTDGLVLKCLGEAYAEVFKVSADGIVSTPILEITGGTDLAEPFQISGGERIPVGALVVIDDRNPGKLALSDHPYDTRVAGVISGAGGIRPGLTLTQDGIFDEGQYVAMSGRVYCLADAASGPISPGDLLTTSDTPGHAMRATDRDRAYGAVIGKAMTGLDEGAGLVLVLVNLQ
jgi:hypothetical protein